MTARLRCYISGDATIRLQVGSTVCPFDPTARSGDNVIDMVGTAGSINPYSITFPCSLGPSERLEFWIQGSPDLTTPAPTTIRTSSIADGALGDPGIVTERGWESSLPASCTQVIFYSPDSAGGNVFAVRTVTSVWPSNGSGNELHWAEPLSATQLSTIASASQDPPGSWWGLTRHSAFGLVGLNLVSEP